MGDSLEERLKLIVERAEMKRANLLAQASRRSKKSRNLILGSTAIAAISSAVTAISIVFKIADSAIFQVMTIIVSLLGSLAGMLTALSLDGEETQRMRQKAGDFLDVKDLATACINGQYSTAIERAQAAQVAFDRYAAVSKEADHLLSAEDNPSAKVSSRRP